MNTVLDRSGLLVSCIEPSRRSVSNRFVPPPDRGLVLIRGLPRGLSTASLSGPWRSLGFAHPQESRRDIQPNRVRYPTDRQFTSSCSPPPLTRTQLPSVTAFRPNLTGTCTLLIRYTYKRTRERPPCRSGCAKRQCRFRTPERHGGRSLQRIIRRPSFTVRRCRWHTRCRWRRVSCRSRTRGWGC
jgi:hypothetical protein